MFSLSRFLGPEPSSTSPPSSRSPRSFLNTNRQLKPATSNQVEKEHAKLVKEAAASQKELQKVTEAAGKGAEAATRADKVSIWKHL
jgi:hypothetical protein